MSTPDPPGLMMSLAFEQCTRERGVRTFCNYYKREYDMRIVI